MSPKKITVSPIATRLRSVRIKKGISQKQLGILAGIDEFSASPRINQYERGKHVPDFATAARLAKALSISVTYFYADDDELAELILLYSSADEEKQSSVLGMLKQSELSSD